ncbi:hypothetical protein Tco_1208112 [Tanacetum coccineum]
MAVVEEPQTLEYKADQLNVAPILEVENFTSWKKRFMCHIIGIEPQFENIILNGPYIPMAAGQRKPKTQWTPEERKAADLDQRLKSLIMYVLQDDQMNSVINCLTAKSTWDDLILYHERPSDVKESRVMDLKLCYNTLKFKEGESLKQTFTRYKALMNKLAFQDSPGDEEDTRSSQEYMNDLEEEYQTRALLAKSKRFFKKGTQRHQFLHIINLFNQNFSTLPQHQPELRPTKDFEAKYNKVKAKLALLSSSASASKSATIKNKGLITEAYEWDEEEVSSDDNEMVDVKVLMALAEENVAISKEGARNSEWVKISMIKVHTLLEIEDNDDRKTYLDYLCIDLNYVEEQRNKLLSKHRDLVHELNACKEQLLVLKQAKLDFLTIQHVNSEILKENKNLRTELKELTAITETWLNNPRSSGQKDLVFVKSLADDTKLSIPGVERPWLSEAKGFILPNHDTATDYDSTDESSVCSTPLPPLEKLDAPTKGNKSSSASKVNSSPAGKLKSVKIEDDPPLAICDIRKPFWYLDSGCSRHMTGVKSYMHIYIEQPGPKVVFGDDSTCVTEGYGSIKCNGIVFTKVAFVNGLKYNLISISHLCDAKYIVQFD